ncbi:EamA/RhaT family transporter [Arenibacter sp. N53]|uniref:DMT family transporter n=1 Tax=Arenibacter TaxID=178469 RepID=UPI000CD442AC|nr:MULTISPECIES: DMT family transporter [Arenibacter]MCM4152904.1 EamA/RhaT family transporter [Arenibacter sp. N53]
MNKSIFYILICVLLWALIPVVSKIGQNGLDNHQFLFWSSLSSLLFFLGIGIYKKRIGHLYKISMNKWLMSIFLGFLGTYLYYVLLYLGYANAPGMEVLIVQYSWPILVALLSLIILKEKLTFPKAVSILLGFLGVFIVLTKGDFQQLKFENLTIDLLVFFGAFVFALFSVLSKKIEMDDISLLTIYFLTSSIISFISMNLFSSFKIPEIDTILPIIINGFLVNGLSYIFWIKALKMAEASFIAPFVFLTPVLSSIFLILFFNEPFYTAYLIGMSCVIIGGLLNARKEKKNIVPIKSF